MAGSVENRGNGSWRLTVSLGQGPDGKYIKKRKTVKAKNKTEAKNKLADFVSEINNDEYFEPTKVKFGDFVDDWRTLHAEKHFASETMETYNYILDSHILPAFARKKLDDFKPIHIKKYLNELDLSSATIYKHYAILRAIFNYACGELEILKSNPVAKVEKPKVTSKKTDVYTDTEVEQLFALLDQELKHYALIAKLAIMGGFRRGEILGLLWENVNFDKNTIYIEYSLSYTKDKGYEMKSPKNGESRTVSMPPYLMAELKDYHHKWKKDKLRVAELWNSKWIREYGEFVFSTHESGANGVPRFGKPFYPGSVSRWWNRFINRTGFKKIRFHDLRHTAATLLINQGEHAKNISSRLGHKTVGITLDLYSHALQDADKNAADKLEKRFGKNNA